MAKLRWLELYGYLITSLLSLNPGPVLLLEAQLCIKIFFLVETTMYQFESYMVLLI